MKPVEESTGPYDQLAQKHKHKGVVQRFEHTLQLLTRLKIPTGMKCLRLVDWHGELKPRAFQAC